MALLAAFEAFAILRRHNTLTQNVEVWLVCCQPQHDQVGVRPVNAVASVWVVARLRPLRPDEVKNFMFTFTRYERIRENDREIGPCWIDVSTLHDK